MDTSRERSLSLKLCLLYNSLFAWRLRKESYSGWHAPLHEMDSQIRYSKWRESQTEKTLRLLGPLDYRGKFVLDFGSGRGGPAIWFARSGASRVLGVDIDDFYLDVSEEYRKEVDPRGELPVEFQRCGTTTIPVEDDSVDLLMSLRVFNRLQDPEGSLREWQRVLKPGGRACVSFGPLWYHPHGIQLWEIFPAPWIHLLFPENVVVAARNELKGDVDRPDRARSFSDLSFNRMSVRKFRKLVENSALVPERYVLSPIWKLKPLTWIPGIREFFSAEINCVLRKV